MFRDPLYRPIRRRLRELKDGDAFELCAADLLRQIYPSLAPREGGDDAGLDGLVASEDKGSIQLICTTGDDVLGNLSKSIESNLKKGGKSHGCILATSQHLTNSKKRNLDQRATELGRPLLQIYDQAAIALLLYRDARWLKELLGLVGTPPPLSLFPVTSRPLIEVPPLGRDEDIAKLSSFAEDFVLVGQPGSGKTHLLFTVAKSAKGRFVVDEDPTHVADGVRDIKPRFLIVDDAHSRLEFLKRLKLLRKQISADFQIVASCWPGQQDSVCAALQLAPEKCHVLDGLPQKQIKEVIQSQKIFGPPELLAEIIHQAQGKPGLAVTLCRLCWESGTTRDVLLGAALARDVKVSFERVLGREVTTLLGCFAIGGDAGMSLESVARLLGKNALEVKRSVEQLAAAGVLDVLPDSRIAVHPTRLRQALVLDVFLKPPAIDLTPYLAEAPDYAASTRVLIEARLLGGSLSDTLLRERLKNLGATGEQAAFDEYAYLGLPEAEWVLDNYPDRLQAVALPALENAPEKALGMLLDSARVDYRQRLSRGGSARAEDIMPEINRWILSAEPAEQATFKRREALVVALERWLAVNKDVDIGIRAVEFVLSTKHESTSTPPGDPYTMTMHWGVVDQCQLSRIFSIWRRVLPILKQAGTAQGSAVTGFLHEWVHPNHPGKGTTPEYEQESRGFARQMLTDLLVAFAGNWTMHHRLRSYAELLGMQGAIQTNPIAEVLYPSLEQDDWRRAREQQLIEADKLAAGWCDADPEEVAEVLAKVEAQFRAADLSSTTWDRHVCLRIAEATDKVDAWLMALFNRAAPPHLVEPFLNKLASTSPSSAAPWVLKALELSAFRRMGVCLAVKHFPVDSPIWSAASPHFNECSTSIGISPLRESVRHENLKALLRFPEPAVAASVAVGMWRDHPTVQIPIELLEDWKNAIVQHVDDDHVLRGAFQEYPDVAFAWIATRLERIRDGTRIISRGRYHQAIPTAIQKLTKEQRRDLIDKASATFGAADLIASLVGRDIDLFRHLLSREELKEVWFDPLRLNYDFAPQAQNVVPELDVGWQKMALAALEKGITEAGVFWASQAGGFSWAGPISSMYAARVRQFEKLLQHPDARLRKVGTIGCEHFSQARDKQLAIEKRAAIRGEIA